MSLTISILDQESVEASEFVEQTFDYWFKDNDHVRSPFPFYIHDELKSLSIDRLYKWTTSLNDEAKKELNDELFAQKFEEIIFETALKLVKTVDERITINYPFMPRIGDRIDKKNDGVGASSVITDRFITKEGDKIFLSVKLKEEESDNAWDTKFELPV